ncbi:c-type cytochrome [Marinicella sp. W31]|uniref:c-type cytochrome n=1 Tax=Marinicella sp. W31 TaxID=3023713 RepID=UPI0037569456
MKLFSLCIIFLLLSLQVQAADIEKGRTVAVTVCKTCHGVDGIGIDETYPKLAGQFASYLEKALLDYRSGERKNVIMQGFAATLSDEDIENVAMYYATLKENRLKDLSIK